MLFHRLLKARGQVEQWLAYVESAMFDAIRSNLKKSLPDLYRMDFTKWILQQHGQIVLISSQILFTGHVEEILNSSQTSSLESVAKELKKKLDDLASVVLTEVSLARRNVIVSLMITLVHQRDTVNDLLNNGVNQPDDFHWIRYVSIAQAKVSFLPLLAWRVIRFQRNWKINLKKSKN